MKFSPAHVGEPEGNGVAEWFIRSLKERVIRPNRLKNVAQAACGGVRPMYPAIALVTNDPIASVALSRQLMSELPRSVEIHQYCASSIVAPLNEEVIVVSSRSILDSVRPFLKGSQRVILAQRTVSPTALEKLSNLPKGRNVIVLLDYLLDAQDAVASLKEMGITWLNLVPASFKSLTLDLIYSAAAVVVFGKTPPFQISIPVIDLGIRRLSVKTVAEVCDALGASLSHVAKVCAGYERELVQIMSRLAASLNEVCDHLSNMQEVLETLEAAILVLTTEGDVVFANGKARSLFLAGLCDLDTMRSVLEQRGLLKNKEGDLQRKIVENFTAGRISFTVQGPLLFSGKRCFLICDDTQSRLEDHVTLSGTEFKAKYTWQDIIGSSRVLMAAVESARKAAATELPILLLGETGVGKELFAHAIHNSSLRARGPFVSLNLSALPEELVESELFGYEKGAFTGARMQGKRGLFEIAHGGTVFLDEFSEASPRIQAKLLRALENKEIIPVGALRPIRINVRTIAATNRDIPELLRSKLVRADLYYRLSCVPVRIPPLRERKEDIPALIAHFSGGLEPGGIIKGEVMRRFMEYDWPGNVRELANAVRYAIATGADPFAQGAKAVKRSVGDSEIRFQVLNTIADYERVNKPIGRRTLCRILGLSERAIRRSLKNLSDEGLIEASFRGLRLTVEGHKRLDRYSGADPR